MSWYDSEENTTPRPVQNDTKEGIPGETRVQVQESNVVDDHRSSRKNKVILLGSHDRYNFGDLIFSKVVAKLLTSRAGYGHADIVYGGLVSVNMSAYGGPARVLNMKELQNRLQHDDLHGPYYIIYTVWGGHGV